MRIYLLQLVTRFFVGILVLTSPIYAQFYTLQTKDMRLVYYDMGHSYIVPHLARCFENSSRFHRQLFQYTPSEEITVFLHDLNDYGTGGANTVPWNYIVVGIEPYDYVYETGPTNERMNWVMNHEYFHVLAMDKSSRADRFFRKLFFGKVHATADHPISMLYSYLTNPRWYSPRWYHEGGAVFMETWMAGGIGRTLGGYDEMVFRTMVCDSSYFYDFVGLESEGTTIDFQVGANSYLYGTRFISYLANQYGPGKLLQWFNRTEDSKGYYTSQFKHIYSVGLDEEWSRWIRWEHEWQRANLDSLHQYPITISRPILDQALGSVSRAYYDSTKSKVYVGVNFPGELAHIASIDIESGRVEKICEVPTPAMYYVSFLAYDPASGTLFFTTDNSRQWRDIHSVDIKTGKKKRLLKDIRVGDLAFNQADRSLWGIRHHNGISTLVKILPPYDNWIEIFPLLYGKDMFDLDISPDGVYLTSSMVEINGRQRLIRLEINKLLTGDADPEVLYEFKDNSPANFVYSRDGKFLFGTSYYTGVSNVFRYDFEQKKMEALTNCETGFFRPLPISKDSLMVFRYSGKGFIPVMIANETCEDASAVKFLGQEVVEKYPIVESWKLDPPSPSRINIDSLTTYSGEYNGMRNIKLASAYPIVEGYKDYTSVGMKLNFFEPVGLHSALLTASYSPSKKSPTDERIHLGFEYQYWQWKVNASYNGADFYDLFGPTKTSRKGYSLSVRYNDALISEKPKSLDYTISVAGYGGLERLPDFQNVATSFDKFLTANGKLNYSYLFRTLGSVEHEQGFKWDLNSHNIFVRSKLFPQMFSNIDLGFLLPLDHSSIWFRSSFGYAPGDISEPFANFYFGGFGNNWVDYQEAKRYRDYYSFPGIELNEAGGTNYGKLMIEWTLPPLRFRRFGIPTLYCTYSQLTFFSSGIITNINNKLYRRSLLNFGSQLDFKLVMFSHLETTFSLGYAVALERYQRFSKEFMVSLKVLK
ncbi:MAG TPA: hypothetical protein VFF29_00035 [Bacteroidota bacterium]|nr:hypothetical protein [Bacteroidota bacterium]